MSTRSGRRIHNDDIIRTEVDVVLKNERKTRSKRVLDNGEEQEVTLKSKRKNYVSYPSEEGDGGQVVEIDAPCKPARALRRTTLKEQNALVEEVHVTNAKAQARQTRRNKKLSETTAEDISTEPIHQDIIEEVTISNGKPKNKKNKKKAAKITDQQQVMDKENATKGNKKKKNKRKKNSQSNSLVGTEEIKMSKDNVYNTSMDSFHSAAGSPVRDEGTSSKESGTLFIDDTSPCNNISNSNVNIGLNSSAQLAVETDMVLNSTFDKESESTNKESSKRKSNLKNVTFEKEKPQSPAEKLNNIFDKEPLRGSSGKKKRKSHQMEGTPANIELLPKNSESAVNKTSSEILNTTFEKHDIVNDPDSQPKNYIKEQKNGLLPINNSPRKSLRKSAALDGTFELSSKSDESKRKSLDSTFDKESKPNSNFDKESKLDSTFDKESKLDSTFDKTTQKPASNKSSLISSDMTGSSLNITLDKSDVSRISITDDDSKTENILNATPVLIESSMEDSKVMDSSSKENKTPETKPATTPLKREGTFTKEESEGALTPNQTPSKRQTLPAAGCTPYHSNNKGPKKSVLNLTHSIEKQRSSLAELPRAPRVMFCSPVNNPGVVMQHKTKVIKSSLKGSNKSFVHEENEPFPRCSSRKRSLAAAGAAPDAGPGAAPGAKRARLPPPPSQPRARTTSAMAKLSSGTTPAKALTPAPKSELKATRLPNFAALHARGFERMESLDECQRRRARRARTLLQPNGSVDIIQKSSPKVTPAKPVTPAKVPKLPTLETLQRGYTRFGFKMDCAVNPFSVPPKPADKPKEIKPKPIQKKPQPSLAGATSMRKAVAKQTIMREKSFTGTGKRDENRKESRTIIKGVRTNRRFELQMKSRNINL